MIQEFQTIKCYECYETALTKGSACSRTRYCEGKWCVKGPDSGGLYRGCMHLLPFNTQTARCYNVTGEDGRINENCYCNSDDFCNSSMRLSLFTSIIIIGYFLLFCCTL
ncbi:unnamed protein product [Dracunculus medinensis]|uniref:Activin_recp domain-containing protein n=1 Tax=Dracunculus medinensis TaxID=318479 RepID=A0A0N4UAN7_DRAME|nr:unnamed protein product [Dracunculus medinensis]